MPRPYADDPTACKSHCGESFNVSEFRAEPMLTRHLFSALLLFASFSVARANVSLASPFSDHAVLQRGKPLPVWGRADPGEHISLSFHGQTVGTTAAPDGRWMVYLEALSASSEPAELIVTGNNTLHVNDLLVGDVWLCSGQSNMEFLVNRAVNAAQEIAAANFPQIRHFKVKRAVADTPLDTAGGDWDVCSPSTVSDFTAVGYFFARDIHQRLNIPVGLINSTWGGTQIESWMSSSSLATNPALAVIHDRWLKTLAEYPERKKAYDAAVAAWSREESAAAAKPKPEKFLIPKPREPATLGHPDTPSGLFNGMINPLLPYALCGFLWYQGEANASRASEYHVLLSTMITSWRGHFGQKELPFFWVQLPNFKAGKANGTEWAFLREAQTQTLSLPNTGQAVIIDLGDPDDVHPRNKQEVGRRLALIARTKVYDSPVDYSGPVFARAVPQGSILRIFFSHASSGLTARDKPLQSFEIAGADKKFYPAAARIDGATVIGSAREVKNPVAVRYGWTNDPPANLYNGAGLPATPFRSDSW